MVNLAVAENVLTNPFIMATKCQTYLSKLLRYGLPIEYFQLTVGAGAVYSDKVYGDVANTKWVPSYVRYDAMARYNVNKMLIFN